MQFVCRSPVTPMAFNVLIKHRSTRETRGAINTPASTRQWLENTEPKNNGTRERKFIGELLFQRTFKRPIIPECDIKFE